MSVHWIQVTFEYRFASVPVTFFITFQGGMPFCPWIYQCKQGSLSFTEGSCMLLVCALTVLC